MQRAPCSQPWRAAHSPEHLWRAVLDGQGAACQARAAHSWHACMQPAKAESDSTVEVTENVLRRLAEAEVRKNDKKSDQDYQKAVDQAYVRVLLGQTTPPDRLCGADGALACRKS